MPVIIEKDISKLATIRTSAYTKYYADINNLQDLKEANIFAKKNNLKLQIIGNGTNILFTKTQYKDILFIRLKKDFNFFRQDYKSVEIGASFSFMRAGEKLMKHGYKDFVYMCLIPGTLGGSVRQNAGTTNEGEVKDNILSVKIFDIFDNKVKVLNKQEMEFSYRNSLIQKKNGRYIILSAIFSYGEKESNLDSLRSLVTKKKKERNEKQPSGHSFGSTFKSQLYEKPTWWYIEQVELKGKTIGEAKFSDKHSNWIVNTNNAKAEDIISLILEAKQKVRTHFNIELIEEVELI